MGPTGLSCLGLARGLRAWVCVLLVGLVCLVGAQAASGPRWRIEPSPSVAGEGSGLFGVSCVSPHACVAVGSASNGGPGLVLEHRARGSWSRDGDPRGFFGGGASGVSCVSRSFCMAVGQLFDSDSRSVTLRWGGSAWSVVEPVPGAEPVFSAVSCTSKSFCMAVGESEPETEAPNASAIAARSFGAIAERWDGQRWVSERVFGVSGDDFSSVSCASPRTCIAVGDNVASTGLTARWNGRTWKLLPKTNLYGTEVSCAAAADCLIVGNANTRRAPAEALLWNGSALRKESSLLRPGRASVFVTGVSCASARSCWAVGRTGSNSSFAVVEHWNGRTWSMQPTPRPIHQPSASSWELNAVACLKTGGCTAVGDFDWPASGSFDPDTSDTLIERLSP